MDMDMDIHVDVGINAFLVSIRPNTQSESLYIDE